MTNRTMLSRDELNEWLTKEIQKVEDLEGSSLTVQYLLNDPDVDECNWSGVVGQVGPNTTAEQLNFAAKLIVDRARALFDLAD